MKQSGFISGLYIYLGLGLIVLTLGTLLKIQSARLESCKAEHQAFVNEVERIGKEAKFKALQIEAENKLKKEKADESLRKLRIANDEFKRLRDNASGRELPRAPADSRNPALSCFDRPELERAYGELVKELRGIADEGTEATIGLDSVKRWSQQP